MSEFAGEVSLHEVRRRCPSCGQEWSGPSFVPPPAEPYEPLPRLCAACCDVEDRRLAELTKPVGPKVEPAVELRPPREPGED